MVRTTWYWRCDSRSACSEISVPLTIVNSAKPTQAPSSTMSRFQSRSAARDWLLARVSMMRPNSIGSANNAAGEHEVGNRQDPAEAGLGPEHCQDAEIKADKIHLTSSGTGKSARNPILSAQLKPGDAVVRRDCG